MTSFGWPDGSQPAEQLPAQGHDFFSGAGSSYVIGKDMIGKAVIAEDED